MERALSEEVLEELGYEIREKNGKFLFMDTISRYLYKNGESVTKLYIPNRYIYRGEEYTITSISGYPYCFERFDNSSGIKLVIVPENLYKRIRRDIRDMDRKVNYEIIGTDENDRIAFYRGVTAEERKAYVNSNGDIIGCTYFRDGDFCARVNEDGVKILSYNVSYSYTSAARIN